MRRLGDLTHALRTVRSTAFGVALAATLAASSAASAQIRASDLYRSLRPEAQLEVATLVERDTLDRVPALAEQTDTGEKQSEERPLQAREFKDPAQHIPTTLNPVSVPDPIFRERLESLTDRSDRLAEALEELKAKGFFVFVGTPGQVEAVLPIVGPDEPMDEDVIGETVSMSSGRRQGRLSGVVVRIDLARIRKIAAQRVDAGEAEDRGAEFDRLLDNVLIHEVWGHLVPLGRAGTMEGACPDPRPGEDIEDACVVQRENDLREDLGLERKQHYGLLAPTSDRRR